MVKKCQNLSKKKKDSLPVVRMSKTTNVTYSSSATLHGSGKSGKTKKKGQKKKSCLEKCSKCLMRCCSAISVTFFFF